MVIISIQKSENEIAKPYVEQLNKTTKVTVLESKEFFGTGDVLKYMFELSVVAAPIIIAWIKAAYKAKSEIKIEVDGIKVQGLSEEKAEEIVEKLLEKKEKKSNKRIKS